MSKKRNKKYKPSHASVPMLVNRVMNDTVEGKEEFAMLNAFQFGTATRDEYDYLIRMANTLNIAANYKADEGLKESVKAINFLAKLILERYQSTGKFRVYSDELAALRNLVTFYDSFWKRQLTNLYNDCVYELNNFYAEIEQKRNVA
jgi:hypothetical protein